jgi:opacity protein-like surface antigen
MKNTFLGLACLLAVSLGLSALAVKAEVQESSAEAPRDNANAWSFDIVPYLWLAGYDGTVGLPNLPAGIPEVPTESADPFGTHISAAAMLTARVRYRDVGLLIDGAWLQLKTEGSLESGLYSSEEIKSDIGYGTLALSYRLPCPGKLTTDIFAGARLWYISNEIEFKPGIAQGFTAEKSRFWVDPILGASLRYDLTRHWYGTVLGDVGGFGVGSDISWSVFGGGGYQFTDWLSVTLGYRYLHIDYDKDQFVMNGNVQGFLLGLGFHF